MSVTLLLRSPTVGVRDAFLRRLSAYTGGMGEAEPPVGDVIEDDDLVVVSGLDATLLDLWEVAACDRELPSVWLAQLVLKGASADTSDPMVASLTDTVRQEENESLAEFAGRCLRHVRLAMSAALPPKAGEGLEHYMERCGFEV